MDIHSFKFNFDRLLILQVSSLSEKPFGSVAMEDILQPDFILRLSNTEFHRVKRRRYTAARVLATRVPITDAPQTHYGNESVDLGRSIPLTTLFAYKEFSVNVCSNPKPYVCTEAYVLEALRLIMWVYT